MPAPEDDPDQFIDEDEVYRRLVDAQRALGTARCDTTRGQNHIAFARRLVVSLQISLVKAQEDGTEDVLGATRPPGSEAP
ncbi:hypothetical protein ACTZWW_04150 [Salinarimonas sp. NSM]|uniref:hypothetical protein n=1 Tax=Salinarimonas sp. NSM TaxID=3458003 RepID=UPI0040373C56